MPKQTQYYKLGYFADGEFLDALTESRRFETVDSQLFGLYSVLGNGVVNGWTLTASGGTVPGIVVGPGTGIVGNIYVATTQSETVEPLTSNSLNYIYATLTNSSYWDKSVQFISYLTGGTRANHIFLGAITIDDTAVTNINIEERETTGLLSSIKEAIAAHRHTGGVDNPSPVDLGSEVQGQISQKNLPELDASIVMTGKFSPTRIPVLDHNTDLSNKGTLTHAQLDAFIEQLSHENASLMGETAIVNLLQLILALKHLYPEIDDYLLNELAFIPGISPDDIVDWTNTTANVDTRTALEGGTHTITGTPGPSFEVFTKTWDTNEEFLDAETYNVAADGDLIRLLPTETKTYVEDFENVSDWQTRIVDLSTGGSSFATDGSTKVLGSSSGKLNIDESINLAFVMEKTFSSEDWSKYKRVVFYLKTDNTDHGDLYFYLQDAKAGTQDSFKLVLEAGAPTINRDSLLQGWREIDLDLSEYTRDSIVSVGFYMSTESGWEPSKPFELNVDEMYLTTGNQFLPTGYSRFTYGNGTPLDFYRVRWDGLNESGIKVRTRLGMSLSEFDESSPNQSVWSSYRSTSGFQIENTLSTLYPFLQIEVFFTAQDNYYVSPEIQRLYLDFRSSSSQTTFSYDSKDEWESGTAVNLDTWTIPGSILISDTSEVGSVTYAQTGKAVKADGQLQDLFEIAGAALPRSTNQILAGTASSFGQLSGVARGALGSFWLADTDNDRVVEVDASGSLLRGFYGSFLSEPLTDPYGLEERGPGSNEEENVEDDTEIAVEDESSESSQYDGTSKVKALHSIYNPSTGILYVVFNQNIEIVHPDTARISAENMYLGAKSHRVYFNDGTEISLLGIDGTKYDLWLNRTNKFKEQFSFLSHVLMIKLSSADMATLSSIVDFAVPGITLTSPKFNEEVASSSITLDFSLLNFQLGGDENNRIKYRIDYGSYSYSLVDSVTIPSLSQGLHYLEASLVDGNGNELQNEEASLKSQFIKNTGAAILDPIISIISPVPSQVLHSSSVSVTFDVKNHPVMDPGSHIRYSVDDGYEQEHRSLDPIQISSLDEGSHTISVWLVDEFGELVVSSYSEAEVEIFVGANALTGLRFYLDKNAVYAEDSSDDSGCYSHYVDTDVAKISFGNIRSPIDVQFIPGEISQVNPTGAASVLIAKLRSPSWTYNLSLSPSDDPNSIYGTNYMDGHSVVQMDMDGNVLFTNNSAKFADSLSTVKIILGSAEKTSNNELLIADAIRNRAIITLTDLSTEKPFIAWQYDSDRAVSDFHLVENTEQVITIDNNGISSEVMNIKSGSSIVWLNDSLVPIQILSGKTTEEQFLSDPDLTLYGDEFSSGIINPGERYSYQFDNIGSFDWFSYDGTTIDSGLVQVSSGRVSSSDKYLLVENDKSSLLFGSRVIKVNSWGDVIWSFGEDWLHHPKDARGAPDGSILIST
ncbi:MAG: hypothetical protein M0R32_07290 [Candidatus Cloacimonetes bacterium]|jgi:hypothetical protein|nr:hypothetical protein [Candidatus Cloacimonadota bacterium]